MLLWKFWRNVRPAAGPGRRALNATERHRVHDVNFLSRGFLFLSTSKTLRSLL